VRIIAQSQFDVNQENTEKADFVAQARGTGRSPFAGWVVFFQRMKIDVLVKTFLVLGFNNFRAYHSHETGINMLYSS
jgi:hypothetical protein